MSVPERDASGRPWCGCTPPPGSYRDFNGYGEHVKCGLCPRPKVDKRGRVLCRKCERHPRHGDSAWCQPCLAERAKVTS